MHKAGKSREQISIRCLEDMVDLDSPARQIDKVVDECDTGYFVKSMPKQTGCPPFNPKDMLKLLIYGMDKGVNSTRKLARECRINVEAMWLLNELKPDSTTIRNFRRENAESLIQFYNEYTKTLYEKGYIDGKIVAIDGTKIRANNSKRNNFTGNKLDRHIEYIDKRLAEYLNEVDKNDRVEELEERKAKYKSFKERIQSGEVTEVSTTDSDSRLMRQGNNGIDVSYNVQAAVDGKHKLVAGIIVTNEPNDQGQLSKVASSVKENLGLKEMTVAADKGYYKIEDFKDCRDNNITTIVAKPEEKKAYKEIFNKTDFQYDKENDCYRCPAGEVLKFYNEDEKGFRRYRNLGACRNCKLKGHCSKSDYRTVCRHKHAEYAEQNDLDFKNNYDIYKQRQELCEHPFGTVKRTMGIRQFLTRGLVNVSAEAALIFLCYNLKRLRSIQANNPNNTRDNPVSCRLLAVFCCFYLSVLHFTKHSRKKF